MLPELFNIAFLKLFFHLLSRYIHSFHSLFFAPELISYCKKRARRAALLLEFDGFPSSLHFQCFQLQKKREIYSISLKVVHSPRTMGKSQLVKRIFQISISNADKKKKKEIAE